MRILCTGDLHMGRRPSRLPAGVDPRPLSCGACWSRIVDCAVEERVDLLAVSGDLVDRENRFYESVGPIEAGLRRLEEAGIETVMVAGNHDHSVLPPLVERLSGSVRLLGRGGRWERVTVERGGARLHVDGWSFPDSHVRTRPLLDYPFAADGAPVLGLLHCDLDAPRSPYAPVALSELRARCPSFWLLGHVHAPRLIESGGGAPVLYPGSPQAMDPGEPGAHGPWLVEIAPGRLPSARQIPLSSVRYDTVEVDVTDADAEPEIDRRVGQGIRAELATRLAEGAGALRYLCVRLRVVGGTSLHAGLERRLRGSMVDLELERDGVRAVVESVSVETRPPLDLDALARGTGAPAELARLIRSLDSGALGSEQEAILRDARAAADRVRGARPYMALPEESPDLARALRGQAMVLLDALMSQKETAT